MKHKSLSFLFFSLCVFASLLFISFPVVADTDRGIQITTGRYALVIGNSAYPVSPLKNPVNDSGDIAQLLGKLDFTVMHRHDVGIREMEKAVRDFGEALRTGGTGVFYYAGHGMQVQGRNYLIPIDAKIESESDVRFEALDVGRVLGKMEDAGNGLNIVILDACRDNPYTRKFRSVRNGLARMDAPRGTFIAYATGPGSVAADGEGRNGVYTKNLLKHLTTPGLPVEQVLKYVRIGVIRDTNQQQVPWESSSLTGNFYFAPALADKTTGYNSETLGSPKSQESLYWEFIKDSDDPALFKAYVEKYPDSVFFEDAQIQLSKLQRSQNEAIVEINSNPKVVDDRNFTGYRIAILPWDVRFPTHLTTVMGKIATYVKESNDFRIATSYYDLEFSGLYGIERPKNIKGDLLWRKDSFFEDIKPDIEQVRQVGRKLGVDVAILGVFDSAGNNISNLRMYLIDIISGKQFVFKNVGKMDVYQGNFHANFSTTLSNLFNDYRELKNDTIYGTDQSDFTVIKLRNISASIKNQSEIDWMLAENGFYDKSRNPRGYFRNKLVAENKKVVIDRRTGLMWQRTGSNKERSFSSAKDYVRQLNDEKYADYNDWRLPTIEELSSLIANKPIDGLYIDPTFDLQKKRCWSSDITDPTISFYTDMLSHAIWIVDFSQGSIVKAIWYDQNEGLNERYGKNRRNYVRAVRSSE